MATAVACLTSFVSPVMAKGKGGGHHGGGSSHVASGGHSGHSKGGKGGKGGGGSGDSLSEILGIVRDVVDR